MAKGVAQRMFSALLHHVVHIDDVRSEEEVSPSLVLNTVDGIGSDFIIANTVRDIASVADEQAGGYRPGDQCPRIAMRSDRTITAVLSETALVIGSGVPSRPDPAFAGFINSGPEAISRRDSTSECSFTGSAAKLSLTRSNLPRLPGNKGSALYARGFDCGESLGTVAAKPDAAWGNGITATAGAEWGRLRVRHGIILRDVALPVVTATREFLYA